MGPEVPDRWAWAEIDLDAVRANVAWLRETVAPAGVWAVVKANGYGHGAVPVARAAVEAGAGGLCVALVGEGVELRRAGIDVPVLVLSEPPPEAMAAAIAHGLDVTVYTAEGVEAAAAAAEPTAAGRTAGAPEGGHRHAARGGRARRGDRAGRADRQARRPRSRGRVHPHRRGRRARPRRPDEQLDAFDRVLAALAGRGIDAPGVHAANSAGAIGHPRSRYDVVRAGIAVYGLPPSPAMRSAAAALRPALSLKARVSLVKQVAAGERVSYGWHHTFETPTTVATLPIGYADGVPRRLFATGGCVLVGGRRCPIVGVVTMDQLMVDCGPVPGSSAATRPCSSAAQGDEEVTADEWADRLGTINYEIVCGIGARVPRRYTGTRKPGGGPAVASRSVPGALELLAAEASTCTRCRLAEGRTQVVWGMGDAHARGSCSSARGRAPRRTGRDSPSSAGVASCSTACCSRRSASAATSATSPTSSCAGRRTTATRSPTRSTPAARTSSRSSS